MLPTVLPSENHAALIPCERSGLEDLRSILRPLAVRHEDADQARRFVGLLSDPNFTSNFVHTALPEMVQFVLFDIAQVGRFDSVSKGERP